MSTTVTAVPRRAAPVPPAGVREADRDEMRRRGSTVIADKVFEKIAGQAASEVTAARGKTGGVLGFGADTEKGARPKVDVDLSSDSVDLDLAVGIAYPGSIRAAAQEVRDRVTERVGELTGVPVHRVDIDVTFLATATGADGAKHRKQALR